MLCDVARTMYYPRLIEELFKPQEMSREATGTSECGRGGLPASEDHAWSRPHSAPSPGAAGTMRKVPVGGDTSDAHTDAAAGSDMAAEPATPASVASTLGKYSTSCSPSAQSPIDGGCQPALPRTRSISDVFAALPSSSMYSGDSKGALIARAMWAWCGSCFGPNQPLAAAECPSMRRDA